MVANPLKNLDAWLVSGVERVAIHCEAVSQEEIKQCAEIVRTHGKKILVALLPNTQPEIALPYVKETDGAFVLSVNPGFAGQKFQKKTLETVRFLAQHLPQQIIEVDGGIDDSTAQLVKDCGATDIVSASYIFNYPNPKIAFNQLQEL
jgi:ribulose-phosphate 3-epimerase